MNFTFNLLDSDSQISKKILLALQSQIDTTFKDIGKKISPKIQQAVEKALKAEPEY